MRKIWRPFHFCLCCLELGLLGEPQGAHGQKQDFRQDRPSFNVRHFGARGDGRSDDTRAFATVLARVAKTAKAEIVVPAGVYLLHVTQDSADLGSDDSGSIKTYLKLPNSDLRLSGAGIDRTRIVTQTEGTFLEGSTSKNAVLELSDLAITYTGGYSTLTNSFAIHFAGQTLRATNVLFRNYTQAIRIPEGAQVSQLFLDRCRFYYDHGRGGVTQADKTFQYPITAILGAADTTSIQNCEFDGLMDPTFSDAGMDRHTGTGIPPSQLTPIDGLIKTINMGGKVRILNNVIRNGGIEHILIDGSGRMTDGVEIAGNRIAGPNPEEVNSGGALPHKLPRQTHSVFYLGAMSGITTTRANTYIHDNEITNTRIGIGADLGLAPAEIGLKLVQNRLLNCVIGIQLLKTREAQVQGNLISINRQFSASERETGDSATQNGIRLIDSPFTKIKDNQIQLQSEDWWEGTMRTETELDAGAHTLKVDPISAELLKVKHCYVALRTVEGSVICSPATVSSSQQLELTWALPAAVPSGTDVRWSIGSIPEQAGVCSYRSSGTTSENNRIQGGIQPFVHFDEKQMGPIISRHDNLQGYPPQKNGAVQFQQ